LLCVTISLRNIKTQIEAEVELLLMHPEMGFENLVLKNTTEDALQRFAELIDWPPHLLTKYPQPEKTPAAALADYFGWAKGTWGIADFLTQCSEAEVPIWLREACKSLMSLCLLSPVAPGA
jgi:putative ATP-dependent endonuclease of OLD family